MFSKALDKLSPAAAFAAQLFAAAKLDFHALYAAGDPQALATLLAKSPGAEAVNAAITEATATLTKQLGDAQAKVTAHEARLSLFDNGIKAAGLTLKPANEKAGLTPEDFKSAIEDRASILAADKLAKHKLDAPLPAGPSADITKPAAAVAPKLTGLARVEAAFRAQREKQPAS